ncbi:unnamed protein product [Phytomonas sp. Hart1]|nr:unnamed protein product [Phytomonas sp. Hart1]|eukprot:CCW67675.1 unnamed protein product [Phytomonas sp. isolate Hart1]
MAPPPGRLPDPRSAGGDFGSHHNQQHETNFSDSAYHKQKRQKTSSGNAKTNTSYQNPPKRWSYILQDIPGVVLRTLNDINKGYVARVLAVAGVVIGTSYGIYHVFLVPWQERKPLARRWYLFCPRVPITLLEKNREEGSQMIVYRFALPHSYDYAGYEPVSSVRMYSGCVRQLSSLTRWYTPISHPRERGFIEFAIKDCDPGRMSGRLRYLERGDVVYLGRWMKEFHYKPNKTPEIGLICSTSGASVALQLMNIIARNPEDRTKLSLLYCHCTAGNIPFKTTYFDPFQAQNPDRIVVRYNVLTMGTKSHPGLVLHENLFVGNLDPSTLQAALPPPRSFVRPDLMSGTDVPGSTLETYRANILVCGPQTMLNYLCGRVNPIFNFTYWQGGFWRYGGFMKDMGYKRQQVYKFGTSTHIFAVH